VSTPDRDLQCGCSWRRETCPLVSDMAAAGCPAARPAATWGTVAFLPRAKYRVVEDGDGWAVRTPDDGGAFS